MRAVSLGQPLGATLEAKVNWLVDAVKRIELASNEQYAESVPIKPITGLTDIKQVQAALEALLTGSPATILTTRGDLIARGASAPMRLPIGAAGTLLRSDGTDPSWATLSAYLDAVFTGEANGDLVGRTAGAWTNRTLAAVLGDMLTTRGDLFRRGASGVERLAALTANTFVGGDGTDVGVRTAAQVLTSLGIEVGTWTPAMTFQTPGTSSIAHGTQQGNYIKISNYYVAWFNMTTTPTIGTGANDVRFSLPVTVGSQVGAGWVSETNNQFSWGASRTALGFKAEASSAFGRIRGSSWASVNRDLERRAGTR